MKLVQFQLFSQAYFDGFTYNLKYSRYLKLDCECNEEIPNTICKLYNSETLLLECRSVTSTDIGNLIKLQHLGVPKDGIAIRQATKSANAGSLRNQGPENVSSLEEVSDATSYLRRSDLMAAELLAYEVKDFFKGKDAILKLLPFKVNVNVNEHIVNTTQALTLNHVPNRQASVLTLDLLGYIQTWMMLL
ncbi:hypothetical protein G4B88_009678 [Cannabis sativa]|uniref:Uncharacterized protein n=1 Tax=Cannabis sativa TaxID=3483 RepID=A0A7J6DQV4_CANSA|nr:hypothetical protein G4B88_017824 [Cannabis sativa]KAF4369295.1 hypothetical protein G4B88_009678 [Cannabis sativa]